MTTGTQTAKHASSQSPQKLTVVIVEDSVADGELLLRELRGAGFDTSATVIQSADEFRAHINATDFDIVLADYNLGNWRGMDALEMLKQAQLDVPLILVSGSLGDEMAVECIKQGATDYVLKDKLNRLPAAIHRALLEKRLRYERRGAEDALAKKVEELARSNRDLEQFAYVASHDLQEPLRMVSAYTQLLSERYKGKLDDQADKYIHYAVDGAIRMQDLIQDLLRFSRVGRGDMSLQTTACDSVVQQVLLNLKGAILESGATIQCGNLPVVMGNRSQLEQVFQNLIGNALKFRNGVVPLVTVGVERKDSNWVFSITDNGIGIAPEHAEVIFSIFQRLHTRDEFAGNGIGLAICKKIIEQHGGKIWLGKQAARGCTFSFSIPMAEKGGLETDE